MIKSDITQHHIAQNNVSVLLSSTTFYHFYAYATNYRQ